MDFVFSPEQLALRDAVRTFLSIEAPGEYVRRGSLIRAPWIADGPSDERAFERLSPGPFSHQSTARPVGSCPADGLLRPMEPMRPIREARRAQYVRNKRDTHDPIVPLHERPADRAGCRG